MKGPSKMEKAPNKKAITPILTLYPIRIENYSYFNAQIKVLLNKYRNSTRNSKFIEEVFREGEIDLKNCLLKSKTGKREKVDIQGVLAGFLEDKIIENNEKFIRGCKKIAKERTEHKKSQKKPVKKETMFQSRRAAPKDLKFIENNFQNPNPLIEFANPFVFMIYRFFDPNRSQKRDRQNMRKSLFHNELNFLENEFYEFVKISVPHKPTSVQQFVKAKYSRANLYTESYDDRFLFAEIFVHLRCGQISEALDLITQFSFFFDSAAPALKNLIFSFYNGKKIPLFEYTRLINTKSDRFKILIYQILTEYSQVTDILNTFNDFLWFKMLHSTSLNDLYAQRELKSSDECKMIVSLFCKKYERAFSILSKPIFPLVETFFTMKRMAFALKIIEPFAELVISLVKQFIKRENKINLINMLDKEEFCLAVSDSSSVLSSKTAHSSQDQSITTSSVTEYSLTPPNTEFLQSNMSKPDLLEGKNIFFYEPNESFNGSEYTKDGVFDARRKGKPVESEIPKYDIERKNLIKKPEYNQKHIKTESTVSQTIAELLVKSNNLDLLATDDQKTLLKPDIVNNIATYFYQTGDRKNLLKLYNLFDNQEMVLEILNEYLTDLILKDKKEIYEYRDVINHFKKCTISVETQRMAILIDLIDFSRTQDIFYLKSSLLFNDPPVALLPSLKPLISKLLPLITHSIQETDDRPMAQLFGKLCNMMGMGERCKTLMGEQLIMML